MQFQIHAKAFRLIKEISTHEIYSGCAGQKTQ